MRKMRRKTSFGYRGDHQVCIEPPKAREGWRYPAKETKSKPNEKDPQCPDVYAIGYVMLANHGFDAPKLQDNAVINAIPVKGFTTEKVLPETVGHPPNDVLPICSCPACLQSSQIVSKSRSPLLSAPQTLHLFRLSLPPNPKPGRRSPGTSRLLLRTSPPPSAALAAASSFASLSASSAASSASGESGIVSSDDMEGLRERADVGVDGMDDEEKDEEKCKPGG